MAEGVREAAQRFGKGTEKYALHVKGLEPPEQGVRGLKAWALGWRTFRVISEGAPLAKNEIECPAARGLTTCDQCRLCDGSRGETDRRKSIAIVAH